MREAARGGGEGRGGEGREDGVGRMEQREEKGRAHKEQAAHDCTRPFPISTSVPLPQAS